MSWQNWTAGRLTEGGDDTTSTVTTYDATGTVTSTRPYTGQENAAADARAVEEQATAARESDRTSIVKDALVWLAADSAQAAARTAQITQAVADIDAQIASVQAYTFAGTTAVAINTSLNNALKPQLAAILTKQRSIGVMLQELQAARARHGQQIAWLGRYVTS